MSGRIIYGARLMQQEHRVREVSLPAGMQDERCGSGGSIERRDADLVEVGPHCSKEEVPLVESCQAALRFIAGLAGTEIASADEVANAIGAEATKSAFKTKQMKTKVWNSLRDVAAEGNSDMARETWDELNNDQQSEVWRELSSGQRAAIKILLEETA